MDEAAFDIRSHIRSQLESIKKAGVGLRIPCPWVAELMGEGGFKHGIKMDAGLA